MFYLLKELQFFLFTGTFSLFNTNGFFSLSLSILLGACSVFIELRVCLPGQLQLGMYVLTSGFKLGELQPVQKWCVFTILRDRGFLLRCKMTLAEWLPDQNRSVSVCIHLC